MLGSEVGRSGRPSAFCGLFPATVGPLLIHSVEISSTESGKVVESAHSCLAQERREARDELLL